LQKRGKFFRESDATKEEKSEEKFHFGRKSIGTFDAKETIVLRSERGSCLILQTIKYFLLDFNWVLNHILGLRSLDVSSLAFSPRLLFCAKFLRLLLCLLFPCL